MRTQADRDDDLAIGRELERKDAEIDRLRAAQDATIRVLSDDRLPPQSRINDARAILARSGDYQQPASGSEKVKP